jgi:excisionase family DNA binding protein
VTGPSGLPPLLKPDEVAMLLRTTRRAAYGLAERGQLPGALRIGRRLLFRRDELLVWLGLQDPEAKP